MANNPTKVWQLSIENGAVEINFPDASGLDAITRQLPRGYYSTFRTFDGGKRVLGLQAHLKRIYHPAALKRIVPSMPIMILRRNLADLLQDYPEDARVRLVMTEMGQIYTMLTALIPLPAEIYSKGVKVITTDVQRQTPRLKSTTFISASENTRTQIANSKIFEALLVRNHFILEGMTSNFFYVKNGNLGTARRDILLGVTRRTVLRVARGSGFSIVYRPMKREQAAALDEAFLTSSSRGIVPIVQIDDVTVGEGVPGPITKELMDGYANYVMRHAERIDLR
jgi:branched-chain amino acid aminotransferase